MNQQITRLQASMTLKLLIKGSAVRAHPGSPNSKVEAADSKAASADFLRTHSQRDHLTRGVKYSLSATLMQPGRCA
jgi:hypothetical protein